MTIDFSHRRTLLIVGNFRAGLASAVAAGDEGVNSSAIWSKRLNADRLKSNGGQPIRLSLDQYRRLNELPKKIDPEVLKRIDLLTDAELRLPEHQSP